MADLKDVTVTLSVEPRWWFKAACLVVTVLWHLRIVTDADRAGKWLATHGVRIVVA